MIGREGGSIKPVGKVAMYDGAKNAISRARREKKERKPPAFEPTGWRKFDSYRRLPDMITWLCMILTCNQPTI